MGQFFFKLYQFGHDTGLLATSPPTTVIQRFLDLGLWVALPPVPPPPKIFRLSDFWLGFWNLSLWVTPPPVLPPTEKSWTFVIFGGNLGLWV